MADYTRAVISPATIRKYDDYCRDAFREKMWIYNRFRKGDASDMVGELLQFTLRSALNPTGAAGGEGGNFPVPGTSTYINLQVAPTTYRNTTAYTDRAARDTRSKASSVESAIDRAMREGPEGIIRQACFDTYGGRFSPRATIHATSGANDGVLTLHAYGTANAYTTNWMDMVGARWLRPGQYVEIRSPAAGTLRRSNTGATDTLFQVTTRTNIGSIILSSVATGAVADWTAGACDIAGDDIIVPAGAFNWGTPTANDPIGYGMFGLMDIVGNPTDTPYARLWANYGLVGINRAANPILDSVTVNAAAGVLTTAMLENTLDAIGQKYDRIDDGRKGLFVCRRETANFIKSIALPGFATFEPQTAPLGIALDSLEFVHGDKPIEFEIDPWCPPSMLYMLNQEELEYYEVEPVSTVKDDKGNVTRLRTALAVAGGTANVYQHIYDILFAGVMQTWSPAPQAHGLIFNYTGIDAEFGQGVTFLPLGG